MSASPHPPRPPFRASIECSRIAPRLYQGSIPPQGWLLRREGFDLVVLCAEEYQPPADRFLGVGVVHAPNDDDYERPMTHGELSTAVAATRKVVASWRRGERILITCRQGKNRSGFVMALSLCALFGWSGAAAIAEVQRQRVYRGKSHVALQNPQFVAKLIEIVPGC